jgi:transcriptional regulator with XRE-family HTH domain
MPGQHVPWEQKYESTGLTTRGRDRVIAELRSRGLSERQIAKRVGLAPSAVHYILCRLAGNPRVQQRYEVCEGCGQNVTKGDLSDGGLCWACEELGR